MGAEVPGNSRRIALTREYAAPQREAASCRFALRQRQRGVDADAAEVVGASTRRSKTSTRCSRRRRSGWWSWWRRPHTRRSWKNPSLAIDPTSSQKSEQLPTYNAYSIDGDVTAPLVYVNYGTPDDYEELERMGISVQGRDCDRALRRIVARHQAQGCGGAWSGGLPDLFRSARRRLFRRRRFSERPDASARSARSGAA